MCDYWKKYHALLLEIKIIYVNEGIEKGIHHFYFSSDTLIVKWSKQYQIDLFYNPYSLVHLPNSLYY